MDAPALNGVVALSDVMVAVDEPEIVAERLNARVELAGERITLSSLTAGLNGGTPHGFGRPGHTRGRLSRRAPPAGRHRRGVGRAARFAQPVGYHRDSHRTGRQLAGQRQGADQGSGPDRRHRFRHGSAGHAHRAAVAGPHRRAQPAARARAVQRAGGDCSADSGRQQPGSRRGRARTCALLGTPYETGLSGRLTVLEGGEITLNERRYEVERGDHHVPGRAPHRPVLRSAAEHDSRQLRRRPGRERASRATPRRR